MRSQKNMWQQMQLGKTHKMWPFDYCAFGESKDRDQLRQDDCWVDLPPKVLPRATPNALEKEAISPIIYFLLCVDI